jgi:hypothetical protein
MPRTVKRKTNRSKSGNRKTVRKRSSKTKKQWVCKKGMYSAMRCEPKNKPKVGGFKVLHFTTKQEYQQWNKIGRPQGMKTRTFLRKNGGFLQQNFLNGKPFGKPLKYGKSSKKRTR